MEDKRMGKQFFLFSIFDPLSSILYPLILYLPSLCLRVSVANPLDQFREQNL